MTTPPDLQKLLTQASDEQLHDVISRPADWSPDACEAAMEEIKRRGVPFEENPPKPAPPPPSGAAYEILPDGSKHFLRATAFDVILSLFVPGFGIVVGGYAMIGKDEKRRGGIMMLIGFVSLYLDILYRNSQR